MSTLCDSAVVSSMSFGLFNLIYNFPFICKFIKTVSWQVRFVLNSDEITQDHEKCTIDLSRDQISSTEMSPSTSFKCFTCPTSI